MEDLVIENKENQIILTINKKGFDEGYLVSLVKRLQVENHAQKSGYTSGILEIAEEINQDWWSANRDEFLKEVKK